MGACSPDTAMLQQSTQGVSRNARSDKAKKDGACFEEGKAVSNCKGCANGIEECVVIIL